LKSLLIGRGVKDWSGLGRVLSEQQNDARALCFLALRQAGFATTRKLMLKPAEMGYAFAQAWMAFFANNNWEKLSWAEKGMFLVACSFVCFHLLLATAAAQGERDGFFRLGQYYEPDEKAKVMRTCVLFFCFEILYRRRMVVIWII
jgi:hypothetical protein